MPPSKQTVQTQTSELESLEKRIKEMEARLQRGGVPSSSSHARTPLNIPQQTDAPRPPSKDEQLQQLQDKARSRPGTARQNQHAAPSSANMPPTPTASEGEYGRAALLFRFRLPSQEPHD